MKRLSYNYDEQRYGIIENEEWFDKGLHCGDCLTVRINGEWIDDRIEYNNDIREWYLIKSNIKGSYLEYIPVK